MTHPAHNIVALNEGNGDSRSLKFLSYLSVMIVCNFCLMVIALTNITSVPVSDFMFHLWGALLVASLGLCLVAYLAPSRIRWVFAVMAGMHLGILAPAVYQVYFVLL